MEEIVERGAARRLWEAIEPLHATVYFAPEPADAAKRVGLRGWWMGYFAGRVAPLGAVPPEPVTAMVFGFAPAMVARALPDAWTFADPATVLTTRIDAVAAALHDRVGAAFGDDLAELADLLWDAVRGCRFDGRPLAAAWAGVRRPDDPVAAAWVATTILREHRGDGHVVAAVAAGLSGLATSVTHTATGATSRALLQPSRGWTDDEWDAAVDALVSRGLLDGDGRLTDAGSATRRDVEATTDRLAAGPVDRLGPAGVERAVALAAPISRALIDGGVVPVPNPIGVPRP